MTLHFGILHSRHGWVKSDLHELFSEHKRKTTWNYFRFVRQRQHTLLPISANSQTWRRLYWTHLININISATFRQDDDNPQNSCIYFQTVNPPLNTLFPTISPPFRVKILTTVSPAMSCHQTEALNKKEERRFSKNRGNILSYRRPFESTTWAKVIVHTEWWQI